MSEHAWLRVHNFNGREYYQIVFDYKKGDEFLLGTERYIDISQAEASLGLDSLVMLHHAKQEALRKKAELSAEELAALVAHEDLVNRITRIIKESNQAGEVESARGFYKKVTGKDWKG